jgi:hypothetical protein
VDQLQSILPCSPHYGANNVLNNKSLYMSGNVCSNMVMVVLRDLIETSLYKDLIVSISSMGKFVCFGYEFRISNFYL